MRLPPCIVGYHYYSQGTIEVWGQIPTTTSVPSHNLRFSALFFFLTTLQKHGCCANTAKLSCPFYVQGNAFFCICCTTAAVLRMAARERMNSWNTCRYLLTNCTRWRSGFGPVIWARSGGMSKPAMTALPPELSDVEGWIPGVGCWTHFSPGVHRRHTNMRAALTMEKWVAITVWKLATPDCPWTVGKIYFDGSCPPGVQSN